MTVLRIRLSLLALAAALGGELPGQAAPDTAAMRRARRLLDAACLADREATWGQSLCGPLLLATWGSRTVVASEPDSAGGFTRIGDYWVGTLGEGQFPSNTATALGGTSWSMVVLPLPSDDAIATTLLVHEQFHRIQRAIGLPLTDPDNTHLAREGDRTLLRLEWRALAAAIAADGGASCRHVADALAFRDARYAASPGARHAEALLERHEGMAEYTGQHLAAAVHPGADDRLRAYLEDAETWPSYVRSFAYATGAAYGALLDRTGTDWRSALRTDSVGPSELLRRRLECPAPPRTLAERSAAYGGAALAALERARSDSLAAIRSSYRARLVDGPVLRTPTGPLRFTFDPNAVFPLGDDGNVYPTGTFSGAWGSLVVRGGGALVSPDFQSVRVPLGARDRDWTLTLNEGWRVGENGQIDRP
jgi:hypothetical protein